jgi:hypothetical protein
MIYSTDHEFDFNLLVLKPPIPYSGSGGHFIKFVIQDSPLYIKPPKCLIKIIAKSSNKKRMNCDLQFSRESDDFIQWVENIENHTQKILYDNRSKWFDSNLEENDIVNSFKPTLTPYKSSKSYLMRTSIPMKDNSITINIYDEHENLVNIENLKENTEVITIIECRGIKCSTRNFIIEYEIKQMMLEKSNNLFDKCILSTSSSIPIITTKEIKIKSMNNLDYLSKNDGTDNSNREYHIKDMSNNDNIEKKEEIPGKIPESLGENHISLVPTVVDKPESIGQNNRDSEIKNELYEVDFNLEEMSEVESVQLKKRNEVYYELYREARRKAKLARDLALSAYLEAKRIKNTYMLDNLKDSDDSDNEIDDDHDDDDEEENIEIDDIEQEDESHRDL